MYKAPINELIADAMQLFDQYSLKSYSRNLIEAYLKYRASDKWTGLNIMKPHFMLIADNNIGDEFAISLLNAAKKISSDKLFGMYSVTEEELLASPAILFSLKKNDFLIIKNSSVEPMSESIAEKWAEIAHNAEDSGCPTMILFASCTAASDRFKPYEHIFYRVFNNHIEFKTIFDETDILNSVNDFIDNTLEWQRTEAFDTGIADYVHHIYPKAGLQNQSFIKDLNKRILGAYFQKGIQDGIVDKECIPYYNQNNITIQKENTSLCIPLYSQHKNKPHPIKNVLILALSTFPYNGKLQASTLLFSDGSSQEYYYQLEPVPRRLIDDLCKSGEKLDEIIMLCTDAVYGTRDTFQINGSQQIAVTDDSGSNISPIDYFVWSIKNYASAKGYNAADISFYDFSPSKEGKMDIAKSVSDILEKIRSLDNDNRDLKPNIYIDTHGGLRTTQEILNSILSLMQIEGIPIKYQNIFSVEYDNKNHTGRIIPAGEVIHIIDFVSGINECINYGRTDSLNRFYSNENKMNPDSDIIKYMTKAAQGIQLCDMGRFESALDKLSAAFSKYKSMPTSNSYLSSFLSTIESNYQELLSPQRSVLDEIAWCAKKGFYQQALTLVESKMPEVIIKNGLLKGECFTTKKRITRITDTYIQYINHAKKPWQNVYNYLFERYGFLCVARDPELVYIPLTPTSDYKNLQHYICADEVVVIESRQDRYPSVNIFESTFADNNRLINPLIQLHMALKNERNKINHATSTEVICDVNIIHHALASYIDMARELKLQ